MHSTSFHGSVTRKSFSKILLWMYKFVLYALVSAENPLEKKIDDGYRRAVEKREEQTRSSAAEAKLTTCRHFGLLWFLHSVVNSQNTDSNVAINFYENKTEGKRKLKHLWFVLFQIKIKNEDQMFSSNKVTRKRIAGETTDFQLVESLNNVNDAAKTIVGQGVAPS